MVQKKGLWELTSQTCRQPAVLGRKVSGLTQETAACHVLAPGSDFGFNHCLTVQVVRGCQAWC